MDGLFQPHQSAGMARQPGGATGETNGREKHFDVLVEENGSDQGTLPAATQANQVFPPLPPPTSHMTRKQLLDKWRQERQKRSNAPNRHPASAHFRPAGVSACKAPNFSTNSRRLTVSSGLGANAHFAASARRKSGCASVPRRHTLGYGSSRGKDVIGSQRGKGVRPVSTACRGKDKRDTAASLPPPQTPMRRSGAPSSSLAKVTPRGFQAAMVLLSMAEKPVVETEQGPSLATQRTRLFPTEADVQSTPNDHEHNSHMAAQQSDFKPSSVVQAQPRLSGAAQPIVKCEPAVPQPSGNDLAEAEAKENEFAGEKGVDYWRKVMEKSRAELQDLCSQWQAVADGVEKGSTAHVNILAVIGATAMLERGRLQQYEKLCTGWTEESGQRRAQSNDLEGLWDLVSMEVEKIKKEFGKLEELRNNDWIEPDQLPAGPVFKPKAKQPIKKGRGGASAAVREAMRAARLKAMEEKKKSAQGLRPAGESEDTAVVAKLSNSLADTLVFAPMAHPPNAAQPLDDKPGEMVAAFSMNGRTRDSTAEQVGAPAASNGQAALSLAATEIKGQAQPLDENTSQQPSTPPGRGGVGALANDSFYNKYFYPESGSKSKTPRQPMRAIQPAECAEDDFFSADVDESLLENARRREGRNKTPLASEAKRRGGWLSTNQRDAKGEAERLGSVRQYALVTPDKNMRELLGTDVVMSPVRRASRLSAKTNHKAYNAVKDIPDTLDFGYAPNKALSGPSPSPTE